MDSEKKIIGRCPLCGGNVIKTCKGYRCENNLGETPSCKLNINGIIGNRKMSDDEITEFLAGRRIMLDGFSTKEGKSFSTVLELADDGAVNMQSVIGKCPRCGGDIRVGARAFNCSNFSNQENQCNFSIWRNIGGHQISLSEAKEICEKEMTTGELEMYRDDGTVYRKRLGLSPDKLQIVKI
ncbi:MAG: type IA DNA topoisomerase [Muribaculaceae bacterium]|nr:type IA DNA topoisomerase [Muribaculaceae bacterium]